MIPGTVHTKHRLPALSEASVFQPALLPSAPLSFPALLHFFPLFLAPEAGRLLPCEGGGHGVQARHLTQGQTDRYGQNDGPEEFKHRGRTSGVPGPVNDV